MNKMIKLPLFLAGLTLIASFLLGFFHFLTDDIIEKNRLNAQNEVYLRVFDFEPDIKSQIDHFKDIDLSKDSLADLADQYSIVSGKIAEDKNNETVGYTFVSQSRGYASMIQVILAFDVDFNVVGYAALSNNETAGYGKKYESLVEEFMIYANVIADESEAYVISGATISGKAIKRACTQILDFVEQVKVGGVK